MGETGRNTSHKSELAEAIKKETGDYSLIEDMMARVVGERFGGMSKEDVKAVMGKEGEGAEGGKHLKQEGSRLVIKSEPGVETEKIVLSAIVPSIQYSHRLRLICSSCRTTEST